MPALCSRVKTIVNQLKMASSTAMVPSSPVSPPNDVVSLPPLRIAMLAPRPPTRIRWGIARMIRKAVVSRLRFVSWGWTAVENGYAMALIIVCDDRRRASLSCDDARRRPCRRRATRWPSTDRARHAASPLRPETDWLRAIPGCPRHHRRWADADVGLRFHRPRRAGPAQRDASHQ